MSDYPAFEIELNPEGGEGFFRYQNAPGEVQRSHLVDRGNSLVVQGELVDVVHGKLSPDGNEGTIVIADFQFIPSKNSRRFKYAAITLRFESEDPTACDIEVASIAPSGHFSMLPTTREVELTRSANASVQGGSAVNAVAGLGWELKESQEKKDQTTLSGTMRLENRQSGGKNTARWTVSENKAQKTGIPTLIRTATLLKRKEKTPGANTKFQAEVEIKCSVDFASSIEESIDMLCGRIPKDDPVIFDPTQPPTSPRFGAAPVESLGTQKLSDHSAVLTTTMLLNTINEVK